MVGLVLAFIATGLRDYRFEQIAEIVILIRHIRFRVVVSRRSWRLRFFSGAAFGIFFLLLG